MLMFYCSCSPWFTVVLILVHLHLISAVKKVHINFIFSNNMHIFDKKWLNIDLKKCYLIK